jgi:hypothetical protein
MIRIKLHITETGRQTLKEQATRYSDVRETFETIDQLRNFLIERYGVIPKGTHKIYRDRLSGDAAIVGFLHSFWNQDISHSSKKWYQTDWIEFWEEDITIRYFKL